MSYSKQCRMFASIINNVLESYGEYLGDAEQVEALAESIASALAKTTKHGEEMIECIMDTLAEKSEIYNQAMI